ncbi:hypothetical protein OIU83_21330 [Flavobacterium sp. LS1R49]|uniref:Uncharacterized protein n=1 Tax=Flavobacterium shii TaxID=2987687 RepID=A0A9X2ZGE7_9FLAO|nr:hypothetical protein [Flavobacterium shii]MCV9930215.1 hypothetical protein [Flavobacterium shii]
MKKHLKYLIYLFLAFVVIAGDGALDFQSKSVDYYQSSLINVSRELNFKDSGLYVFNQVKSQGKTFFPIPLRYVEFTVVFSFQIKIVLKVQKFLYQRLSLFVAQSVFVNEIITSNTPY